MFDVDGDGFLSRSELESMMRALLQIKLDNSGERVHEFKNIKKSLFEHDFKSEYRLVFLSMTCKRQS